MVGILQRTVIIGVADSLPGKYDAGPSPYQDNGYIERSQLTFGNNDSLQDSRLKIFEPRRQPCLFRLIDNLLPKTSSTIVSHHILATNR